jgi:hypothetical protein
MTERKSALWLFVALLLLVSIFASMPPVVDEESYLFIGSSIGDNLSRPYDWWRAWQPLGETPADNTFVYAHPPLHLWWVAICHSLSGSLSSLRVVVALPWLALLSGSVVYLANTLSRRSGWALALWASCPIVMLGCQASLMIDLPFVALSTVGVALWVKSCREESSSVSFMVTGAVLGLACITKYPALVLLPVFAIHARKGGHWAGFGRALVAFLFVFGGVEVWLMVQYGEFHLLRVIESVSVIDRGPIVGRGFGLLVRLGVMFTPLLLIMNRGLRAPILGAIAGIIGLSVVGIGDFGVIGITAILVLFAVSGVIVSLIVDGVLATSAKNNDAMLLSVWAAAVLLSVLFGHNYAGGRYLFPSVLPLAILLSNSPIFGGAKSSMMGLAVGAWAAVSVLLVVGVDREARAMVSLADSTNGFTASGSRLFSGEWTFRYAMTQNGWSWLGPEGQLQAGDLVAIPSNSGAGLVPRADLLLVDRVVSQEQYPFRLTDYQGDIGYHSELLGRLPFGFSMGEWHAVDLYRVE